MDCTMLPTQPNESTMRAASSPYASPSHPAPVSKKTLTFPSSVSHAWAADSDEETEDSLAELHTRDNNVSENTIKKMLLSLQ